MINIVEERNFFFSFFTIILELIGIIIRPLTLTFRLFVNLIFGVVIQILIGYFEQNFYVLILILFEIFVFTIQIFIYFTLILEYISE